MTSWAGLERICTDDGGLESVNEAWLAWSGVALGALLGRGWWRFVHAEDRARVQDQWLEAVRGGDAFQTTYRFCNGRSVRRVLERVVPLETPHGQRWRAQVQEITNWPADASAPRSAGAFIEFDARGTLSFATREAQALLGFARTPLWGARLEEVMARLGLGAAPEPETGSSASARARTATEAVLGAVRAEFTLSVHGQALTLCFRSEPSAVLSPPTFKSRAQPASS